VPASLEVLLSEPGRVGTAEELLERVWDDHIDPFTNAIRTTVMRLRRKLGPPDIIQTVAGAGYKLDDPDG
jgi:DNA-binding response OmpR family regulator